MMQIIKVIYIMVQSHIRENIYCVMNFEIAQECIIFF